MAGQEHSLRDDAPNLCRFQIVDEDDGASDQTLGRIGFSDSGHHRLFTLARLHAQDEQTVCLGMELGADDARGDQIELLEIFKSDERIGR